LIITVCMVESIEGDVIVGGVGRSKVAVPPAGAAAEHDDRLVDDHERCRVS
jgi:hypothetical protein